MHNAARAMCLGDENSHSEMSRRWVPGTRGSGRCRARLVIGIGRFMHAFIFCTIRLAYESGFPSLSLPPPLSRSHFLFVSLFIPLSLLLSLPHVLSPEHELNKIRILWVSRPGGLDSESYTSTL